MFLCSASRNLGGNLVWKWMMMKNKDDEKKTLEEARDDVPYAIGKHHASVKASFPIYMLLPNSAYSTE